MTRDEFVGRVQAFESAVTEVWDAEWDTEEEREALAARDRALESLLSAFDALDRCAALAEEWEREASFGSVYPDVPGTLRVCAAALRAALSAEEGRETSGDEYRDDGNGFRRGDAGGEK